MGSKSVCSEGDNGNAPYLTLLYEDATARIADCKSQMWAIVRWSVTLIAAILAFNSTSVSQAPSALVAGAVAFSGVAGVASIVAMRVELTGHRRRQRRLWQLMGGEAAQIFRNAASEVMARALIDSVQILILLGAPIVALAYLGFYDAGT